MFKSTEISVEPATDGKKPLNMPELIKQYYLESAA
jgi:formylmethanofuran dehydrogenase subunit D